MVDQPVVGVREGFIEPGVELVDPHVSGLPGTMAKSYTASKGHNLYGPACRRHRALLSSQNKARLDTLCVSKAPKMRSADFLLDAFWSLVEIKQQGVPWQL